MKNWNLVIQTSNFVGTIHTPEGLRRALKLKPGTLDFLEIRVDAFAENHGSLPPLLGKLKLPLILTVRHPLEGGGHSLSLQKRRELFQAFLPFASLIDVELRSARDLGGVLAEARARKVKIILSHHDFKRTPPLERLARLARRAMALKADVFKAATAASSPREIAILLAFLEKHRGTPVSVMGMGAFGKVSRLLFAQMGSVLNYGFLDQAQLRGQWPAELLKSRVEELLRL